MCNKLTSLMGDDAGMNYFNEIDEDLERIITSYDPSGKAHPEESMDAPNGVSNG